MPNNFEKRVLQNLTAEEIQSNRLSYQAYELGYPANHTDLWDSSGFKSNRQNTFRCFADTFLISVDFAGDLCCLSVFFEQMECKMNPANSRFLLNWVSDMRSSTLCTFEHTDIKHMIEMYAYINVQ